MNRLYPLVLEHRLPSLVRYCISACIMLVCAVLQMALQMQTGAPGYFLPLPGVFLAGLLFDGGSGIFAAFIAVAVGSYLRYAGGFGVDFLATNSAASCWRTRPKRCCCKKWRTAPRTISPS